MPATLEEIKDWLDDLVKAGSLSDDERKGLEATLGKPGVADHIKGSQLRQADFSRKMNEVSEQQKALDSEKANVAKLQQELVDWKGGSEAKYNKAIADLKAAQTRAFQLEQGLQTEYGIDPATLLGNGTAPLANPTQPDTSAFLTKEQFDKALDERMNGRLQSVVTDLVSWPSAIYKMDREAKRLGIENYDPDQVWQKMVETKNWDPAVSFNTLYNADAIRQQKQKEEMDAALAKAREEGIKAGKAEAALPQSRVAPTDSYVQALVKGSEPAAQGAGVSSDRSHVSRAADALSEATGVPRR